ncbi:MAG: substrate-binding domain-containing protein, partial [Candidatus Competibacteraceae bacterium]|nr:substrate-binding domain-containing protein [Candidatus Competibacteraceae bacterium]
MLNKILLNRLLPAAVLSLSAVAVQANELNLYCSAQIEWCEAMSSAFSRETGIRVNMTRKSSGETYAQLKAESANPRGDVWWGGTGDPHVQAAEEGLSQ